jgi:hypothetical protein
MATLGSTDRPCEDVKFPPSTALVPSAQCAQGVRAVGRWRTKAKASFFRRHLGPKSPGPIPLSIICCLTGTSAFRWSHNQQNREPCAWRIAD